MSNTDQNTRQRQYQPDFEELLNLAKGDPALFEAKRAEYIEYFFTSVPAEKQRRLRGLQWQIDQARKLARTPMASCLNIMNMMWDSLSQLSEEQRSLENLTNLNRNTAQESSAYPSLSASTSNKSEVIPFPAR